jgi:hypothetical protein
MICLFSACPVPSKRQPRKKQALDLAVNQEHFDTLVTCDAKDIEPSSNGQALDIPAPEKLPNRG